MKHIAMQDNADSDNRDCRGSQLDSAILAALAEQGGQPVPWSALRAQLPESRFWSPIEALVRLAEAGLVEATKINGKTWVAAPLTIAAA